jgi:hypothetical protein
VRSKVTFLLEPSNLIQSNNAHIYGNEHCSEIFFKVCKGAK